MDKKGHLLSHLKKQVLALKSQLEGLQKHKSSKLSKHIHLDSRHNKSISHSPRFDSQTYDSSYLERGIKKFYQPVDKFKNISQIIHQKSVMGRTPKFSSQRKAEYEKTKENFKTQMPEQSRSRSRSPNPLTGQGYCDKKNGIKTNFERTIQKNERPSEKKHFYHIYY